MTATQESLLTKLNGYPFVHTLLSSSLALYDKAKQQSTLVKNVDALASPYVSKAYEYAKPLETHAISALDKLETAVVTVKHLDERRVLAQAQVVHTVGRLVSDPLDLALDVVDSFLPAETTTATTAVPATSDGDELPQPNGEVHAEHVRPSKPVAKLQFLGNRVYKVAQLGVARAIPYASATVTQLTDFTFAVNLVEYARNHADVKQFTKFLELAAPLQERAFGVRVYVQNQATAAYTAVAGRLHNSDFKKTFDLLFEPHLAGLKTHAERAIVVTLGVIQSTYEFAQKQVKLTWQLEWSQVINNSLKAAREIVDHANAIRTQQLDRLFVLAFDSRVLLEQQFALLVSGAARYLGSMQAVVFLQSRLRPIAAAIGLPKDAGILIQFHSKAE